MSAKPTKDNFATESDVEDTRREPSVAQAAIRKLVYLAELIPKELSPGDRAILWILILIGVVVIAFAAVVAISKNTVPLLILFVLGMGFPAVAMIYFAGRKQLAQERSVAE